MEAAGPGGVRQPAAGGPAGPLPGPAGRRFGGLSSLLALFRIAERDPFWLFNLSDVDFPVNRVFKNLESFKNLN